MAKKHTIFYGEKRDLIDNVVHWGHEIGLISEDIRTATNKDDLIDWTTNIITFCERVINDAQLLQEQMKEE